MRYQTIYRDHYDLGSILECLNFIILNLNILYDVIPILPFVDSALAPTKQYRYFVLKTNYDRCYFCIGAYLFLFYVALRYSLL